MVGEEEDRSVCGLAVTTAFQPFPSPRWIGVGALGGVATSLVIEEARHESFGGR